MGTIRFLEKIRPLWVDRVSHRLARGEGVRENFLEELNRFFDLLLEAVNTGDPAWLEPLLNEWATAQTQTDLETSDASLTPILSQILLVTNEVCLEVLGPDLGSHAFGAMLPVSLGKMNSILASMATRIFLKHYSLC